MKCFTLNIIQYWKWAILMYLNILRLLNICNVIYYLNENKQEQYKRWYRKNKLFISKKLNAYEIEHVSWFEFIDQFYDRQNYSNFWSDQNIICHAFLIITVIFIFSFWKT